MKPDAKRIWLLDMGGEISWCDEPSPDPLHEYDAYLYIHADDLRKLVEECVDATSGHVTDWDEGVLWATKKIKQLLDGGE